MKLEKLWELAEKDALTGYVVFYGQEKDPVGTVFSDIGNKAWKVLDVKEYRVLGGELWSYKMLCQLTPLKIPNRRAAVKATKDSRK